MRVNYIIYEVQSHAFSDFKEDKTFVYTPA